MYTHLQLRDSARPPVTLATLHKMREAREPIACLTCYDASMAVLVTAFSLLTDSLRDALDPKLK